jgi:hypothetical protein
MDMTNILGTDTISVFKREREREREREKTENGSVIIFR